MRHFKKKTELVSAAGLTDPYLRLVTTPAVKRANLGLQSFVDHHQFRQAAPLEPRMKNRKKKPWNKFHMGPLNNLAKCSRRFFSWNKFTVKQRMSMLPRLWVFYITEVFWKTSKPRLSPNRTTQKKMGSFHVFCQDVSHVLHLKRLMALQGLSPSQIKSHT